MENVPSYPSSSVKDETMELPGERDNARNNASRKTTHSLDGPHQDVDKTHYGRFSENGKEQR